jgi:hypothetical protein
VLHVALLIKFKNLPIKKKKKIHPPSPPHPSSHESSLLQNNSNPIDFFSTMLVAEEIPGKQNGSFTKT